MNPNIIRFFDVTGPDAGTFLQGQLSQDVMVWSDVQTIRRAAWCTAKGRILASFYMYRIDDGYRLIVADDLYEQVVKRLKMFVLRAKVSITPTALNANWCQTPCPALVHEGNWLSLVSVNVVNYGLNLDPESQGTVAELDWTQAHILAGCAWITAATSEHFVPQSINFELVQGVNFKKGCYPGQEIVARSQYLGKLKRRGVIAKFAGATPIGMSDVYVMDDPNQLEPVGSVVMVQAPYVFFECSQTFITQGKTLCIKDSETKQCQELMLQELPYAIQDITL